MSRTRKRRKERRPPLHVGEVWVTHKRHRRIVAMLDSGERPYVRYSRGGDHVHDCLVTTFQRWAEQKKARRVR
jgi:hypothetical protein